MHQRRRRVVPAIALAATATIVLPGTALGATKSAVKSASKSKSAAKKDPIKIGYVGIESGPNAMANRHNTIELAVAQLNAKGGLDGHPIQLMIEDGGQTAEQALTATKKLLSSNPNVLVGFPVTAQVQAVAPVVRPTRIPMIHVAQNPVLAKKEIGQNNVYRMNVSADRQVKALVKYAVDTWKPKKVGLLNTSDTNSVFGGDTAEAGFKAAGAEVIRRQVPFTSTDLTEAITAMKSAGVDITVSWGFPNIDSLFMKQRSQNGLTVPHIMDTSGAVVAYGATNSDTELKGLNYVSQCDGDLMPGKVAAAYRKAYIAKYGKLDSASNNPSNYDLLYFLNAAVAKADKQYKKADAASLNKVLQAGVSYTGVCGTFKANADNDLMTTMYIVSADGGASNKKIVATYKSS